MDATFWVGAAFVIFIGILVYLKVPGMLTSALDERAKKISDDLDQARELREEAQVLFATYQRKQRDALQEAEEIVAHAKEAAAALLRPQIGKQQHDERESRGYHPGAGPSTHHF